MNADSVPGLALFGVGLLLWWGGYYAGLVIAWRAGVRSVGLAIGAGVMGICGCFAIPLLAYYWSKVQSGVYAMVNELGDDEPVPQHMTHFQIAAGVAIIGLVLQLVAGYVLPEDDGYDDYEYGDSYDGYDDYDDDPVEDREGDYAADDAYDDEAYADEAYDDGPSEDDALDDGLAADDAELDPAGSVDPDETAEVDPDVPVAPHVLRGIYLGTTANRRHAALLVGSRATWVARERRRPWSRVTLGASVSVEGSRDNDLFVASALTEQEEAPFANLPRPFVVRASEPVSLEDLAGQYVLLPAPHALSATRVRLSDGTELAVRAPRGALSRDTDYTAVRGVLVNTEPVSRRGGIELWILREGDVVGL